MILDPDALLKLLAQHAAKLGVPAPVSRAKMPVIVAEAARLAGGRREDEPAALFCICARYARLFGKTSPPFLDDVASVQAAAVGFELDASELDVLLLRGRIASGAADWEAVRGEFAGWLRRAGEEPNRAPPNRPRLPEDLVERLLLGVSEERRDDVVAACERLLERGREEGRAVAHREILLKQIRIRFGALPRSVVTRVQAAEPAQLERWLDCVATARTLADALAEE
jgi:hypothetical protein